MAWLKADGSPVAMKPITIQIDVPAEKVGDANMGAALSVIGVNWGGILSAAIQLVLAMMTGNAAGIASALQALINAFMGK